MDLYLLAELKTISLKVTTVDMQKPPPDFRYVHECNVLHKYEYQLDGDTMRQTIQSCIIIRFVILQYNAVHNTA